LLIFEQDAFALSMARPSSLAASWPASTRSAADAAEDGSLDLFARISN
jgi:hypothetical protein